MPGGAAGRGGVHCYPANRSVYLSQTADVPNQVGVDVDIVALGLVNFLLFCNEHLGPRYGWVDEMGDTAPSEESIERGEVENLCWANLFGPERAKVVGGHFLREALQG